MSLWYYDAGSWYLLARTSEVSTYQNFLYDRPVVRWTGSSTASESTIRRALRELVLEGRHWVVLEDGVARVTEWYGTYYAGVKRIANDNVFQVSDATFATPGEASRAAETILAALPAQTRALCVPSFIVTTNGQALEVSAQTFAPEIEGAPWEFGTSTTRPEEFQIAETCGHCGWPGHRKSSCQAKVSYDMVGIEIEGRWLDQGGVSRKAQRKGMEAKSDGSIQRSTTSNALPMEICTVPGTVASALAQLVEFYPDEADRSCGMHVHTSFKDVTCISQLMTWQFYNYFVDRMMRWGKGRNLKDNGAFFSRLRGENDYCRKNTKDYFTCDNPLDTGRYFHLNFGAWHGHKTLECRLLPMFRDMPTGVSAVLELMSIYEDFLGQVAKSALATRIEPIVLAGEAVEGYKLKEVADLELGFLQAKESLIIDLPKLPPVTPGHRRIAIAKGLPIDPSILGLAS